MSNETKVYYTLTDEAPYLATASFLPIVKSFLKKADISIVEKDISLAARVLANFSDYLSDDQKINDALNELGELAKIDGSIIIKLPNISASIPQLKNTIKELQKNGYQVPHFPENPSNDEEEKVRSIYAKVLGSAVNPVLREGNSDRRVARAVKEFAQNNPHRLGEWGKDSKTHVAYMSEGDFYSSEKSSILSKDDTVSIQLVNENGEKSILKENLKLLKGEVIDASRMSMKKLEKFLRYEFDEAKNQGVLISYHLKATMMKVSDPILFGAGVRIYFQELFEKYGQEFNDIGFNPNNGLGDLLQKLTGLDKESQDKIMNDLNEIYKKNAGLAMVNSDNGITNLHVPSDVIIDASMPAMIKAGGKMWNADGNEQDTKAIIPDRCYAKIYEETVNFCKENGAFDVKSMGNVANVGLMAKKAEEYGSHDKTFQLKENGKIQVVDSSGKVLLEHEVEKNDIWRMCQTKDVAIKDWVKLGVNRARLTGSPAVFWLDENRSHDKILIEKVSEYLKELDTENLEILILPPKEATAYTLKRVKEGLDTISVTGNVLRDYLTDLFPILELGTSAKMLSIVPLLAGGGLFETGAGGSAPKHVEQFVKENHLRWDSLGEFLALAAALEDIGEKRNNSKAKILAEALNKASSDLLNNDKSPKRKVHEHDNRGSHFYLSYYWAKALKDQTEDKLLQGTFSSLFNQLKEHENNINEELISSQGNSVDIEGYYFPKREKVQLYMRPSKKFNEIIDNF